MNIIKENLMDMQFGLGLKLALGGFLKKLRFDKLKTQHAMSRYENIFSWRVAKDKELDKIAKLSTDKMDKLTKSINKLNHLDIKAGFVGEKASNI